MDQLQGDHDTVSRDAIGAQSHAEEDASWQAAKSTKKRKQEALERRRGSAGLQDQVKTGTPTFKKLPKLPPLPKDDYKIVIRPNQGFPLRNILTPTLAQAIIEACQAGIRDDPFILRINPGSNIAILSTKYEEVADKVRLIRALVLNGRAHAVRAYAANGDDTLRGVIHGVPMNTSTETLMAHLRVRTHGVEIITARMIGTTKSAAITFFGPTLPRTVYYYGGELRCYPFRPTIQVCKVCREKGHRADVCPHPDRPICRLCGLTNPTDGHPCSISCASCGEAHPTGDPTCKKRLKPPKPKQPQVQAGYSDKLQQGTSNDPPRTKNLRWFSSEEEENAYKSADDKHSSRSHSRSPGRKPHSPSKNSAPAPTQQNLHRGPPGGGAKGNGGDQGCTQQASSLPELYNNNWRTFCDSLKGTLSTKKTWNILRSLLDPSATRTETNATLQRLAGEFQGDPDQLIEELKQRYTGERKRNVSPTPSQEYNGEPNTELDAPITFAEVYAAAQSFKRNTAPGLDGITNAMVRNLSDEALQAITDHFNQEVWTPSGKIPAEWTLAQVVLIPKPGKRRSLDQLRPISLTSCIGKLFEKVILNRLEQ
ncbi:hypothetical protein HPB51_018959 [Rhipicephalus microplus]|uniref:Tick transposon n=1 Tax=Rhipicephalus microplus TaxID=6941 RepID=A0A9J6D638_RHIMP|nr:hypothetical protein HPB51_018959 [Rhipicephalus microplus]